MYVVFVVGGGGGLRARSLNFRVKGLGALIFGGRAQGFERHFVWGGWVGGGGGAGAGERAWGLEFRVSDGGPVVRKGTGPYNGDLQVELS